MIKTGNQKLRVGIVSTSYPITASSTSGIFIRRLVEQLQPYVEPIVVTPATNATSNSMPSRSVEIYTFSYAPRTWQVLAHQPGGIPGAVRHNRIVVALIPIFLAAMLIACIRAGRRVDIFHANWSINGVIAGLAGLLTNTPVITTLRGSDVSGVEQSAIRRWLLKLASSLSARVITVGEAVQNRVTPFIPAGKSQIIPNGIGPEFLGIPELSTSSPVLRFTAIGNLVEAKGFDILLEAISRLPNREQICVKLVGDGPLRADLSALSDSLGISHICHFVGAVSPEEIPGIYRDTDIFVISSLREGRSNVLLEAMASARPIVAPEIDGIAELIQDGITGLLYKRGNIDGLKISLERMRMDPGARARMGNAARQYILEQRLTWHETAKRYIDVYNEVLTESPLPRSNRHT